jgi:hypothetical protein
MRIKTEPMKLPGMLREGIDQFFNVSAEILEKNGIRVPCENHEEKEEAAQPTPGAPEAEKIAQTPRHTPDLAVLPEV